MIRPVLGTAALASSALFAAAALAAPTQDIAYVKVAGSVNELYVANHDGTGLTKVYATAKKHGITALDFSPAGDELAFVERASGSPAVLKRLRLKDSGAADGAPVAVPNLCGTVDYVDYNPTDPSVLMISGFCNQQIYVGRVGVDGTGFATLQQGNANLYVSEGRWLRDGVSYIYVKSVQPNVQMLCRDGCDPNAGQLLWSGTQIVWNDVARTTDSVIFTDNVGNMRLVDQSGTEVTPPVASGRDAHFSPGDDAIIYRTPHQASGDYVLIYDFNVSRRVTGKGEWGPVDWRP